MNLLGHGFLSSLNLCLRIGAVNHMNDVICIFRLLQGALKGFYQIVGKENICSHINLALERAKEIIR